jgi:organic radical activating enzyme
VTAHLPYVEFNITNVCNLNCPDCVTYNNFAFRGHSRWSAWADIYEQWSQLLDLDRLAIVGGEPMLNPDFETWARSLRRLWPRAQILVLTNGTQLHKYPDLRQLLQDCKITLKISAHGHANRSKVLSQLSKVLSPQASVSYDIDHHELQSWQNSYNRIRDATWPACSDPREFANLPYVIQRECRELHNFDADTWLKNSWRQTWQDGDITVFVDLSDSFLPAAIRRDTVRGTWTLHDSDPNKSIEVCCGRWVPTFVNGKLHKCSTVALLPEFVRQFDLDISDDDRELIHAYLPASSKDEIITIGRFVEDLRRGDAIAQCKFCSESGEVGAQFEATTKKLRFYPRSV